MGFQLYNCFDTKSLQVSDLDPTAYAIPGLSGEVMEVAYYRLEKRGGARGAGFLKTAPAAYTVAMGIFRRSDGSRLAYQDNTGFIDDAGLGRKLGSLSLTTAPITAVWAEAAGTTTSVDVDFTIFVATANGSHESYRAQTTLYKPLITALTSVPPAGDVVALQAWVLGNFVRRNAPAGSHNIMRDDAGNAFEVFIENGQVQCRPLGDAPAAFP
jgi:hypothetical protein